MGHQKMRSADRVRSGARRLGFNQTSNTSSCGTITVVPEEQPTPGDGDGELSPPVGPAGLALLAGAALAGGVALAGREE